MSIENNAIIATSISVEVNQWYKTLVEDLADIITETGFASRWSLIEGYHQAGTRILQENENFERSQIYGEKIAQRIAESLGKSERTINYAVKFAKTYPDLSLLPEAKNTSWHHIVNKYLTTGEKKSTVKKVDLLRMIKEIKTLLQQEWEKTHQEINRTDFAFNTNIDSVKYREYQGLQGEYIRYLQDQIEKITGNNND